MAPWETATPTDPLFRLGRVPDPLAWVPWAHVGEGRFDDPERRFRVLYGGERRTCFLESLAQFRPTVGGSITQRFSSEWLASRRIATFTLEDPGRGGRWLDLREPAAHELLRRELAARLLELSVPDFDVSAATSPNLSLSQTIGG